MTVAMGVLAAALGASGLLLVLAWAFQERILFQPSGPPWPDGAGARRVEYRAGDGVPLFAFVIDGARPERGAVLAFHGNADLAGWLVPWAREAARRTGRTVVLAEYRGYGGAAGRPTVAGVRRDALAAYRVVLDSLRIPAEKIALYGHSLGSAVATELADSEGAEMLILESPFTSARAMARLAISRPVEVAWKAVSRIPYDTESRVRTLAIPVWVAHGTRDVIVPTSMGESVWRAARVPGELLLVPDAGHNDVSDVAGERYWSWLSRALGGA